MCSAEMKLKVGLISSSCVVSVLASRKVVCKGVMIWFLPLIGRGCCMKIVELARRRL